MNQASTINNRAIDDYVDSLQKESRKIGNEAMDKRDDFVAKRNDYQFINDKRYLRHDIDQEDFLQSTEMKNSDYKSKWASSQTNIREESEEKSSEDDDLSVYDVTFSDDDELPIFADEECKRLHKLTKQMERESDEAINAVKENKDRISIMHEHLHNVRQEIDQTNGLVAAKNNEISTEKHLIALGERERAVMISDIKTTYVTIDSEKERLRSIQNQIHVLTDEREKLKLDLNWNQEELEQWATAAAKKESDTLALQKYTRADEVMIKELTLKLENMTKKSVEKKAQLENEITETYTKQLEVDRLVKSFRSQHEERRLLVQQWQETVNAMKDRDRDINELSSKYAGFQQTLNKQLTNIAHKKESLIVSKSDNELLIQEIDATERMVQSKRQERHIAHDNLQGFQDEMDALKLENIASSSSLEQKKMILQVLETEADGKVHQLDTFESRFNDIKASLEKEANITVSHENVNLHTEERLKEREKDLKMKEQLIQTLKHQMFKDSQVVAQLRQKESDLISEIRSTQATAKNLLTKCKQLEKERSKQQELLYNAEFQLQQMERKVARGLGERSDEEKKQLQLQVDDLEVEHRRRKDRQATLLQQDKKLQQELQKWQRKREHCEIDQRELSEAIVDVELEITACELNLKKLIVEKEEEMVSHDLVRLEVRRLRDILRNKIEEVIELENYREKIFNEMLVKKGEKNIQKEVQIAQLRVCEDERHKSAVELGQRKIASEKMQLKYEALTKAHGNDTDGEEENSPVYHLISAAQRRAELQREGDLLDAEIYKREKELRAMEKTLSHLRERNTDFRSSFSKVDKKSKNYKVLVVLEEQVKSSEKALLEAKKECQLSKRRYDGYRKKMENNRQSLQLLTEENDSLEETKLRLNIELKKFTDNIEKGRTNITQQRKVHKQRDYPNITLKANQESIQELLFRAEIEESHSAQVIDMLVEIGREFPDMCHSIMESLSQERIEVRF